MTTKWAIVAVVVVVLGGGVAFAAFSLTDDAEPQAPAPSASPTAEAEPVSSADSVREIVPAQPFIYAETSLDPSDTQAEAVDALLQRFPALGGADETLARIRSALDEGMQEDVGMSFTEDVEPWLGDQVAGFSFAPQFVSQEAPPAALLVEVADEAAANAFLEEFLPKAAEGDVGTSEYAGTEYFVDESADGGDEEGAAGIVSGYLVFGSEAGLQRVVDASQGESIAEAERFLTAVEPLPADRLGILYMDVKTLFQGLPGFGVLSATAAGPFGEALEQTQAVALLAEPNAAVFESAGPLSGGLLGSSTEAFASDPGLMEELPAGSWLGISIPELGPTARKIFDQLQSGAMPGVDLDAVLGPLEAQFGIDIEKDFLSWMGDTAIFAGGATPLEVHGGWLLESTKPSKSAVSLGKLRKILARTGAPVGRLRMPGAVGFSISDASAPEPINFAARGERVAVVYGSAATKDVLDTTSGPGLGDDPIFRTATAALGDGYTASFYVSLQPVIRLIETSIGELDPTYTEEVKPNLQPLLHVIAGSRVDGETTRGRLVIGVR